jgi:hypothetical protein
MSFIKYLELLKAASHFSETKGDALYPQSRKLISQLRDKVNLFVFDTVPPIENLPDLPADAEEDDLDLPFPTCAFENLGRMSLFELRAKDDPTRLISVDVLVINEVSPKKYEGWVLWFHKGDPQTSLQYNAFRPDEFPRYFRSIQRMYLSQFKRAVLGIETTNEAVKIKTDGQKVHHRLRKIIRVVPKGRASETKAAFGRTINWSHRFEVRGHWRKSDTLGKDREGNYCVEGYTWVVPHTRGPEELPLVKKVRLVADSSVNSLSDEVVKASQD